MCYEQHEPHAPPGSAVYRPLMGLSKLDFHTASVQFVSPGSLSGGSFGLFRWQMAPRSGGPSPHFHKTFSESFYVLSGRVQLYDGGQWIEATAGDFLYVPEWGVHAFRNDSDEPAATLILFAPGAPRERYFEELADIIRSERQLSREEWTKLYARHDVHML